MCLVYLFSGLERRWCLSAWSEVRPHQPQSRWGPSPRARPSHRPHVSHSLPCLASRSDHSHNKRHNLGETAGCSARAEPETAKLCIRFFFFFFEEWVCPTLLKSIRNTVQESVKCQTFVIFLLCRYICAVAWCRKILLIADALLGRAKQLHHQVCLLRVCIQLWWMEVLWYSPIRRHAFLLSCPLMHYKWAHQHLQRDTWGSWDTTDQCFLSSSKEQWTPRDLAGRKPCDTAIQNHQTKDGLQF